MLQRTVSLVYMIPTTCLLVGGSGTQRINIGIEKAVHGDLNQQAPADQHFVWRCDCSLWERID